MGSGWQSTLLRAWQTRGPLAWALWPVSLLYRLIVWSRRWLYRTGGLTSVRVPVPVIVVGNVVVGGVGKTPVVIALATHLQGKGWHVGVISRGHGRVTTDCREVLPTDDAAQAGDESLLIRRQTGCPVFVAAQRTAAAQALLQAYPATQVILADDGLQHTALHRDMEICVFDDRGIGNGFLLPAGMLREPWPRPSDVMGWVLHTGASPQFAGFRCHRELADHALRQDGGVIPLAVFKEAGAAELHAVAGIAQPEVFFDQLRLQGLHLSHTQALPDHSNFDSWAQPSGRTTAVLCTEKDAVKLWRCHPDVLAVPLLVTIDAALLSAIETELSRRLSSASTLR